MISTTTALIAIALGALVVQRVLELRKLLQRVGDHPGWRLLISPIIPLPLPKLRWITSGWMWQMREGYNRARLGAASSSGSARMQRSRSTVRTSSPPCALLRAVFCACCSGGSQASLFPTEVSYYVADPVTIKARCRRRTLPGGTHNQRSHRTSTSRASASRSRSSFTTSLTSSAPTSWAATAPSGRSAAPVWTRVVSTR